MGVRLTKDDEGMHQPGGEINWNESRYIDFWDADRHLGGWFRIGARPNAHYAEMSACLFLPDGRVAFAFERAEIEFGQMPTAIDEHQLAGPFASQFAQAIAHRVIDDAPIRFVDLVEHDEAVAAVPGGSQAITN